jgi:hypothetical protein
VKPGIVSQVLQGRKRRDRDRETENGSFVVIQESIF